MDGCKRRDLRGIERTLRATAIGVALMLTVWMLREILLLAFGAVLAGCLLRGASNALHRRSGIGPTWSLFAVVATLVLAFGLTIWWRGPQMADETVQLAQELATQVRQLWHSLERTGWGAWVAHHLLESVRSMGDGLAGYATGLANSTLGIAGSFVVVIATALFLAASPETYVTGILRLLPIPWRQRGREVLNDMGLSLQLWFMGQLVDMACVTGCIGAGLFALGVPLAPTLAAFAGLFNFVPYVGALAGAIPAVLVALAQSPTLALWVALLFAVVQGLEGNVVAPLIQKRTVSLPPALTIMSQTILGTLFGVPGLILATPVVAAALTAVRMIYVESILEGDDPGPADRPMALAATPQAKKNAMPNAT